MKNHKEFMQALIDGETVIDSMDSDNWWRIGCGGFIVHSESAVTIPFHLSSLSIKQKTININGFDVPEPLNIAPKKGTEYYIVDTSGDYEGHMLGWDGDELDYKWLEYGLIHLTEESAELHRDALLSFTKKKD